MKRSQVVCSRSLIFLLKIKLLISLSRFKVFEPCKSLPLRCARWEQLQAVVLEKRGRVAFSFYFLPLLSSVVSTRVIVQAIKAIGVETGQGCYSPGRGSWTKGTFGIKQPVLVIHRWWNQGLLDWRLNGFSTATQPVGGTASSRSPAFCLT